jgi:cellobiose phosphorylase
LDFGVYLFLLKRFHLEIGVFMQSNMGIDETALMRIDSGELEFSFTMTGDIHRMSCGSIMLNQLLGNEIDGSLSNISLRVRRDERNDAESGNPIAFYPLLGKDSNSTFELGSSKAQWSGSAAGVGYTVTVQLCARENGQSAWFWNVELRKDSSVDDAFDVVFAQDLGIADEGAITNNEAYNSQYIDQSAYDDDGFVICSRNTIGASSGFPAVETGGFGDVKVDGYLTDGFQFYGREYKQTGVPRALTLPQFDNAVYQYEMSMAVLKTAVFTLDDPKDIVFYQLFHADYPQAFTHSTPKAGLEEMLELHSLCAHELTRVELVRPTLHLTGVVNGNPLAEEELCRRYPVIEFGEHIGGALVSGFTPNGAHFVTEAKEAVLEREHGSIILSGNSTSVTDRGLVSTSYMYGLFNSQVVIGNASMNKLLGNQRNHLNLFKVAGQRLFIKRGEAEDGAGAYAMLGMPSLFEMGLNYEKWVYALDDDTIEVTNFAANHEKSIQLEVRSVKGLRYHYLLMNQVILDEREYKSSVDITSYESGSSDSSDSSGVAKVFDFTSCEGSATKMGNPNLRYRFAFDSDAHYLSSAELFEGRTFLSNSIALFELDGDFTLKMTGSLDGSLDGNLCGAFLDFDTEKTQYADFISSVAGGFRFEAARTALGATETLPAIFEKINLILPWFVLDMLIHYLSPHGLEQYGGAAWGTRDLSQGPVEFFLATQNYAQVREILVKLFSHQNFEVGDWPQWFMFDEYLPIFADDAHGDVIVWPLFAVAEYLEHTGDTTLLDEQVPYVGSKTREFTSYTETVEQHIDRELSYITGHFLPGTALSIYGNGDWDDTLQPADQSMKDSMASSWTVALTYQAVKKYAENIETRNLPKANKRYALTDAIRDDFNRYLVKDGVIPGFVHMLGQSSEGVEFEYVIHPEDQKTGITYRLLPLGRSIISELASSQLAERNCDIIRGHLTFNDGVRLMDKPPRYRGGVSVNFKRAEQSANFGREIGLLYVHAQIRYVEMLAKLGNSSQAWDQLEKVIPIGITQTVSNAEPRQANTYFSSSDGDFLTRYAAQEGFDKLRDGTVGVKGGWRVYSSGPGISLNQLISNLVGIRGFRGGVIIDPLLPEDVDDVVVDFRLNNQPVKFHLVRSDADAVSIDGNPVPTEKIKNSYRACGLLITKEALAAVKPGSELYCSFSKK